MPAQSGGSILLSYGQQGAAQSGGAITLDYAPAAPSGARRVTSSTAAAWGAASDKDIGSRSPFAKAVNALAGRSVQWGEAARVHSAGNVLWLRAASQAGAAIAGWLQFGRPCRAQAVADWPPGRTADGDLLVRWGEYGEIRLSSNAAIWMRGESRFYYAAPAWPGGGIKCENEPRGVWGRSRKRENSRDIPWLRFSRPINPGWGVVSPGGPPTPEPGETIVIPVRSIYIVVNEIQLVRVVGTIPIPATALSISFDCDSWLPSFSASLPESARDAVMPDPSPVEVKAHINGAEFHFLVEKITRSRQFGQSGVQISGRGIACELDAPYAVASQHTNGDAATAQQLIDAALTNTGYSQDWQITDWLAPAGALSMFGTPAAVAGHVAEAAGAVLAAAWDDRVLRMLPRYPVKPWDWATATPGYSIPGAVAQTEGIEWIEKPAYNVVYVSGVQAGVLGQVKITGTAGDLPAPMVTHPLITHADAARQRGISILGDTGRKAMLQISMPVLESAGVIDLCQLIEFNDGVTARRGIVRANQISVNWPTVRQTLTVEATA